MIQVEAAQEILVGLARAGMLGRGEARHGLDQFARAKQGTNGEVRIGDASLAGRGRAAQVVGARPQTEIASTSWA